MAISQGIRNIIFDLGGVILNIDYHLTINAFKDLGIENFDELYTQAKQSPLFDDFETGKIGPQAFREGLREYLGASITDEQIDYAWNAMLLDLPAERITLLEELKDKYRTFLLSNTNAIHEPVYCASIEKEHGVKDLSHLFEKQYYSFEIGLRKPHKEIFEFVLNENALNPAETLFIDDSIQHVAGAKTAGIHAIHLTGGKTINDLFA